MSSQRNDPAKRLQSSNVTFDEAVYLFLQECKIRNLTEETIRRYHKGLTKFRQHLETKKLNLVTLTPYDLTHRIIPSMLDEGLALRTVNCNLCILKEFFKFQMGDCASVVPLTLQELAEVDLKSSLFSAHAREREDERYSENLQELQRSLCTKEYLAFRETRGRVSCAGFQIDCSPDFRTIISVNESARIEGSTSLGLLETENLKNAIKDRREQEKRHPSEEQLPIDIDVGEAYKVSGMTVTTQVITTTTRFVLSEDCSRVITVIKFTKSFGEWRKQYDKDQKCKGLKKIYKKLNL